MFGPVAASVFASAMNTTANTMRYSMNTSPRSSRNNFSVHVMFASVRVASYEQASCRRLRPANLRAQGRGHRAGVVGGHADGGVALFALRGREGDTVAVDVACPQGYKSPAQPLEVRLRRLSDAKQRTEYDVSCPPSIRKVIVAVRANNGKNLPV